MRLTFRNCDVLQQKNNGGYGQLWSQCGYELSVNDRLTEVLKSTGHCLKDLDGVSTLRALSVTSVEVGRDCENDQNKGVSHHGKEKENAS